MEPAKYELVIHRGGTYESGKISRTVDGVTLNFAQYNSMTLRVKPPWKHTAVVETDDDLLLTITDVTGHIVMAVDELSISITIPVDEIDAYTFEKGRYFLDLHTAAGVTHKLIYGAFTVLGEDDI